MGDAHRCYIGAPSGLGYFEQSPRRFALKGHKISAQGIALRQQDGFRTRKVLNPSL